MPVKSLPQDKPKIAFHAAMMAIENFGFFMMYYDIWGFTPGPQTAGGVVTDPCESTRAAVSFFALTCFCVAFLCVGMGYGGIRAFDTHLLPAYATSSPARVSLCSGPRPRQLSRGCDL